MKKNRNMVKNHYHKKAEGECLHVFLYDKKWEMNPCVEIEHKKMNAEGIWELLDVRSIECPDFSTAAKRFVVEMENCKKRKWPAGVHSLAQKVEHLRLTKAL